MKLLNISLLTLFAFGVQNLAAKRMESSVYVKQEIGKATKVLENTVKGLEQLKNFKKPEGAKIAPLSNDEKASIDHGIAKLKIAITALR